MLASPRKKFANIQSKPRPYLSPAMGSATPVTFAAKGHLNQLLQLSLLLVARGLPIHFAAPEPHLLDTRACLHCLVGTLPAAVCFRTLDVPVHKSPALDSSSLDSASISRLRLGVVFGEENKNELLPLGVHGNRRATKPA